MPVSAILLSISLGAGQTPSPLEVDKAGEKWVAGDAEEDVARGQGRAAARLVVPVELPQHRLARSSRRWSRQSTSIASAAFTCSAATEPVPPRAARTRPTASVTLGQPLEAASIAQPAAGDRAHPAAQHRRLRDGRRLPHHGRDRRSRARWRSARPATRSSRTRPGASPAMEARALGVHVNFAPVVDVNNNPRNPVINTRSFGEDPELVGRLGVRLRPRPAGARA